MIVENVYLGIVDGPANRNRPFTWLDPMERRPDGGFGGSVEIPYRSPGFDKPSCEFTAEGLTSAEDLKSRSTLPPRFQKQSPGHGRGLHDRDVLILEHPGQNRTIGNGEFRSYDQLRSADQGEVQFESCNIERGRRHSKQAIGRVHSRVPLHGSQKVGQRLVEHLHSLWCSSGAGGVNNVCTLLCLDCIPW